MNRSEVQDRIAILKAEEVELQKDADAKKRAHATADMLLFFNRRYREQLEKVFYVGDLVAREIETCQRGCCSYTLKGRVAEVQFTDNRFRYTVVLEDGKQQVWTESDSLSKATPERSATRSIPRRTPRRLL